MDSHVLDRLWTLALWRKPWAGAPRIFLPQQPIIFSESVATVARKFGLPGLARKLPAEIVLMIHGYSEPAALWRLGAALDLAAELNSTTPTTTVDGVVSHSLRRVVSWQRGSVPMLAREQRPLPIIRLTIDAHGIKSIERLPDEEPPPSRARFDHLAFIIEHQAGIGPGRVSVSFKVRSRSSLPRHQHRTRS